MLFKLYKKRFLKKNSKKKFNQKFKKFLSYKNKIYFTLHRRENFGKPAQKFFNTINKLGYKDTAIIYPVHPNPNIKKMLIKILEKKIIFF